MNSFGVVKGPPFDVRKGCSWHEHRGRSGDPYASDERVLGHPLEEWAKANASESAQRAWESSSLFAGCHITLSINTLSAMSVERKRIVLRVKPGAPANEGNSPSGLFQRNAMREFAFNFKMTTRKNLLDRGGLLSSC